MKKILLLHLLLVINLYVNAQFELTYDKNGKLNDLQQKPRQPGLTVKLPDDAGIKKEARKVLNDKCLKAAEMLSDENNLVFYREIWPSAGDINKLKTELIAIGTDNITSLPSPPYHLNNLISFLPLNDSVYTYTSSNTTVQVVYKNIVNLMLLSYYNSVISQPANLQVRTLTPDKYILYSNFIVDSYKSITAAASTARKEFSEENRIALEAAHGFRTDPLYTHIIALLRNPWFAQWFWYTEGILRLHPFEFAGTPFLLKYPEYDVFKSSLYNEYIDSLLQRRIRNDSVEKLEEFKKLLSAKQNSYQEFSYLDRIKKIKDENDAALKAITTVSSALNETNFPSGKKGAIAAHLYYFGDKNVSGTYLEQRENNVIKAGETKTIAVHNVPSASKVYIRESTTPFNDVSEFRQFTDEASVGITNLIPGLQQASGIVSSIQSILRPDRLAVPNLQGQVELTVPYIRDEIEAFHSLIDPSSRLNRADIERHFKDLPIFNQSVFDRLIRDRTLSFARLLASVNSINDPRFNQLIAIYTAAYNDFYQATLETARNDSIILFHIINAIVNSTLPPGNYTPVNVAKPLYSTFIKKTSPYDDPVTNSVRIVSFEKDSSTLATFKYNVGKLYKFQITGGIAASFPSPVVNTLHQANGAYSVQQKREDIRVIAGINFYIFSKGLFLQNTSLRPSRDRFSFYTGVGIPDPLKNIYIGLAYDIVPSVRILGGVHLHNRTEYEIKNNQLAKTDNVYKPYPFVGFGFDPISFSKILNLFK